MHLRPPEERLCHQRQFRRERIAILSLVALVSNLSTVVLALSSPSASSNPSTTISPVFGRDDPIFRVIEQYAPKKDDRSSFGHLLDAGTGLYSLRWMASLHTSNKIHSTAAVTAEPNMYESVYQASEQLNMMNNNNQHTVLLGNWFSANLLDLPRPSFDSILCEYLIGAMDAYSPYRQDEMIPMLVNLLENKGRLYIVGTEPIPDKTENENTNILCEIRRVREACILLTDNTNNQRPYREYPLEWMTRQVQQQTSCRVVHTETFPVMYTQQKIVALLNAARRGLPFFKSSELAESMAKVLDELEERAAAIIEGTPDKRLELGFDYLVVVEKL